MVYISNKRLIMFRKIPPEVLLEISHEDIRAAVLKEKDHYTGDKRQELYLLLTEEETVRLHTKDVKALKNAIEDIMKKKELRLEDNPVLLDKEEVPGDFLQLEEVVTHKEKMWYQIPSIDNGIIHYQWKPGKLYLTDKRLCWWYDFDQKLLLDIPSDKLVHVTVKDVQFENKLVQEKAMIILYKEERENKAACFSVNETSLREWEKVIRGLIKENEVEKSTETCPRCGRNADRESLLENGCSRCGWESQRGNKP